jgi:GNAT superfamily N-acetyltransferase
VYTIERLSPAHDRGSFDCGEQTLNEYLRRYAGQHDRKGLGRTYVAVERGGSAVKGYYTILSGAVSFEIVPENLPRHPVPVLLLGHLAVDRTAQGHGVGAMLLIHALKRAVDVSEQLGVHAVAVDALNDSARAFYLKYGFSELLDDPLHLFLSIKKIRQLDL